MYGEHTWIAAPGMLSQVSQLAFQTDEILCNVILNDFVYFLCSRSRACPIANGFNGAIRRSTRVIALRDKSLSKNKIPVEELACRRV